MIKVKQPMRNLLAPAVLVCCGLLAASVQAHSADEIQAALDAAYAKYQHLEEGANADYIPALAKVDPDIYGIALATTDG